MSKKIMTILTLCLFLLCGERNDAMSVDTSLAISQPDTVWTREDSISAMNEQLFEAFFYSLAFKESNLQPRVKGKHNKGGGISHGYVQIMPIFVCSANLNRWCEENNVKVLPKNWKRIVKDRYYTIRDAYDWDKSKEMVYWVNKKMFDKYDQSNKLYDEALWRAVIKTHNKNASRKYMTDILMTYKQRIKMLEDDGVD